MKPTWSVFEVMMLDTIEIVAAAIPAILVGWAAIRRAEAILIRARKGCSGREEGK
jgi:hypothetical protein